MHLQPRTFKPTSNFKYIANFISYTPQAQNYIIMLCKSVSGFAGKTDLDRARAAMVVGCLEDYMKSAISVRMESDEDKKVHLNINMSFL